MYISKLFLDVNLPPVRHDLSSLNFFYDTLKKITGGGEPVYRIDNVPLNMTGNLQPVVLLSQNEPDIKGGGVPAAYVRKIESLRYDIPVRNGMNYKFMLKANPSVKIFFKWSDLDTDENCREWLKSEASANGFEIIDLSLKDDGFITCSEKKVKLRSVIFEGSLKITDDTKFRKALFSGIGRGIEYGLGLLSIESFGCKNRNIAEEMKNAANKKKD